jgi:N-methylhydantoinase B
MPDKIPAAAHGSMNNLMMGGTLPETGEPWAFYETIGGGYGGRNGLDGVDAVQVNMTNTMNTPIEVMEHYYPIRFESYTIRHDSGGLGEWRGGMGIERSFTARARIHIALIGERTRIAPYGLWGGLPGRKAEYFIVKGNGERIQLRSKDAAELESGDRLVICSAGGGGFGDPTRRNTASIQKDLADDYLSEARNS